ncbi:hypothetical protein Scep_020149 [Stephania cephalantha]|uniref:Uncharacterized protein n=1 Tax=Stephania cephalantha TaxID=152367 RepID=A0AAP0NP00_9MAGN
MSVQQTLTEIYCVGASGDVEACSSSHERYFFRLLYASPPISLLSYVCVLRKRMKESNEPELKKIEMRRPGRRAAVGQPQLIDGREQRSAAVSQGGCVARRRSDGGQGGCAAARRWRTASAEVGSGGDRTSGSVAVQRELMAGDVDAGEGLDGRQRRGSSDAGSGVAQQRGRRGGSDERVGSAAKARECGAGRRRRR